jgi:hypothetical protein
VITAELDRRSYDRAMKGLEKYADRPFKKRMEAAYLAGARLAVAPMKAAAPGTLKKVTVRKGRPTAGNFIRVGAKPRRPHAGLVTKGHRMVTHEPGKRQVGRVGGSPIVSDVIASHQDRIVRFIREATFDEGVSTFGTIGGFE